MTTEGMKIAHAWNFQKTWGEALRQKYPQNVVLDFCADLDSLLRHTRLDTLEDAAKWLEGLCVGDDERIAFDAAAEHVRDLSRSLSGGEHG